MGKARIIESYSDCRYKIEVIFDTTNTDLRIQALEEKLVDLQWKLTADYLKQGDEYKTTELKILYVNKELEFLRAIPRTTEVTVWCVDYSKELTGEIGTIETHGEVGFSPFHQLLVKPGYGGKHIYDPETDGILATVPEQLPEQWLYNTMALPGWQKWQPMFRVGKILYIDGENDTAHVELDDAYSSAVIDDNKLNIGKDEYKILNNVPIEYMSCHSDAFEVDDRVIVQFSGRSWTGDKKIIGFETNPQECPIYLRLKVNGHRHRSTMSGKTLRIVQENPQTGQMEQVGNPITASVNENGVAGPFPGVDLGRPFYAELYYRGSGYWAGRPITWFNYFQLATEAEHDHHLNISYFQGGTHSIAQYLEGTYLNFIEGDYFSDGSSTNDYQYGYSWYVDRVEWLRSEEGSLHNVEQIKVDTPSYGTIRAYEINFICKNIRYQKKSWQLDDACVATYNSYPRCVWYEGLTHAQKEKIWEIKAHWGYTGYEYDCPQIDGDPGWAWLGSHIGDNSDGAWQIEGTNLFSHFPEEDISPQDIYDFWSTNPIYGFTGSYAEHYESDGNWDLYTCPFIITNEYGEIMTEPPDCTIYGALGIYCLVYYTYDEENQFTYREVIQTADQAYKTFRFECVELPKEFC